VHKLLILLAGLWVFGVSASAQQSSVVGTDSQDLTPGTVLPKVVTRANPEQSYALYLPASYSPAKKFPIIYIFDPGARGNVPVELMKDAAERYGYIVVGSNNSRNGSWKVESDAAKAMLDDTEERLALDPVRAYFAGFSGGARVAAVVAQMCKCAAGVLLNGAGFPPESSSSPGSSVAVFSAVGTYDFNYGEVVRMDDQLESRRYAHFLRRFDGPHQWAPAGIMDEALAWFRIEAMKSGRTSKDDAFLAAAAAQMTERARALERSGDLYFAWKDYRQAGEALNGLTDATNLRARADTLEKDKVVRDGAKREKQEFEDQDNLTEDISAGLRSLRDVQPNGVDHRTDLEQKIIILHDRAAREKRGERVRVLKRALAGVFVEAMELGAQRLDQKDPGPAREYFELACAADPDSVWALSNLAVAKALTGDRKGTLDALRHGKSKSEDPAKFVDWMKDEPAFSKFKNTPEFNALAGPAPRR
jgi:predicted esterase